MDLADGRPARLHQERCAIVERLGPNGTAVAVCGPGSATIPDLPTARR